MAYTTKYSFTYTDVFGVVSVVNLKLKDYAGEVVSLPLGGINYEFGRNRGDGVVRGSSATIGLWTLTQAQFAEFRSITDREWMVEHIKNSVPFWYGWLTPEIFSEPFKKSLPYRIEISAVDGLGDLSNIAYLGANDALLVNRESFKTIIQRCLNAAQLGMNFVFSASLHPLEMTGDIFDQCTYSNAAFIDTDGKALKCADVLERFRPLGITVKQWGAKWYVLRTADLIVNVKVYEYAPDGTYVNEYFMDLISTIDDTSNSNAVNLPLADTGTLSHSQAYKEKEINVEYGKKPSFLLNHDFSSGLSGWTELNSAYASAQSSQDGSFILLNGYTHNSIEGMIIQTAEVEHTTDDFVFSFRVGTFGWITSGGAHRPININYKLRVILNYMTAQPYFLSTTGGWVTTSAEITGTLQSSTNLANPKWTDISILTSGIPADGNITIQLVRIPVTVSPNQGTFILGVGFTNIIMDHPSDSYIAATGLKCVNNVNYNYIPAKEDIFINDCPNEVNASLLYSNYVANAAGVPTTLWTMPGLSASYTLAELFLREEVSLHKIPQRKVDISIRGVFDWCGMVADNEGNVYEIVSATLNERNQVWQMELCEILEYSGGANVTGAIRLYDPASSSTRSVNGANDYRVISDVGNPKQIHDLTHTLTIPSTAKIEVERVGISQSEYVTVAELMAALSRPMKRLTPAPDGVTVAFSTPEPFKAGTTQIYIGGLRMTVDVDYTETNGFIVFAEVPQVGEILTCDYIIL